MTMEEALVLRLTGSAAVSAIVGTAVSWFERVRKLGVPAVTLTKISPGRDWTHGGPDGLDGPRVQVDCWAPAMTQCATLARAVRAVFEAPGVISNVTFHEGFLDGEDWIAEGDQDGGTTIYRIRMDFIFYFKEA